MTIDRQQKCSELNKKNNNKMSSCGKTKYSLKKKNLLNNSFG